jgi:hypothetical protein
MGTEEGEKAKTIIESHDEKITPTICLAEVYAKTLKVEGEELAEKQRTFIKEKSALSPLDEPIAVEAAKIQNRLKKEIDGWGLADKYEKELTEQDYVLLDKVAELVISGSPEIYNIYENAPELKVPREIRSYTQSGMQMIQLPL